MTQKHAYLIRAYGTTLLAATWAFLSACSSSKDAGSGLGGENLAGGGVGSGTDGGGYTGPSFGSGGSSGSGGSGGLDPSQICDGVDFAAEAMPVDMYIMFDKSTSMTATTSGSTVTKWDAVTNAVKSFVQQTAATGIGVGIQYFGLPNPLNTAQNGQECDPAVYAVPAIPIALLPGVAPSIIGSIDGQMPDQLTPTGPALQGAIDYMKAWAPSHLGRAPIVVLVTDGYPTQCTPKDIPLIEDVAELAATTEPIVRTYVIGIGEGVSNLNSIARGGGTGQAFLLETGDVGQQFLDTMLSIASTPLQCEFDMPTDPEDPTMQYDSTKVQVVYVRAGSGTEEEIPKLQQLNDCSLNMGNGWYYDYEGDPTKILICPDTCKKFAAGRVSIRLGCTPKGGIIQ